jgi:hypothetical protein
VFRHICRDDAAMSEHKGIFSAIAEPIGHEMQQHLNASPLRQSQNRAVWGTAALTFGAYVGHTFLLTERIDFWRGVHVYFRTLHAAWDTSWPYYVWGGAMLFGLLWLVIGIRGSRAPRQIMTAFWALAWAVAASAAWWNEWYFGDWPTVDWFLKGLYLTFMAGSLMLFWLAMRGAGPGAVRLIQQQIARQAKVFRTCRKRSF